MVTEFVAKTDLPSPRSREIRLEEYRPSAALPHVGRAFVACGAPIGLFQIDEDTCYAKSGLSWLGAPEGRNQWRKA